MTGLRPRPGRVAVLGVRVRFAPHAGCRGSQAPPLPPMMKQMLKRFTSHFMLRAEKDLLSAPIRSPQRSLLTGRFVPWLRPRPGTVAVMGVEDSA